MACPTDSILSPSTLPSFQVRADDEASFGVIDRIAEEVKAGVHTPILSATVI